MNWLRLPAGVWALGLVSLFMDVSSEMIHALLPVYLVTGLGSSVLAVGIIEGVAEAVAAITKVFSGILSDWLGRRKVLATLGYGLAALTKPVFPLAATVGWVAAARFIDRLGKGIRGAPRDALVADLSPAGLRGASFGLRQSLDTVGAFLGPLLAIALMWLMADRFNAVFWVAVVPGLISFALIVFAVHEPRRNFHAPRVRSPVTLRELGRLNAACWGVIALGAVFTLARFSEAFLILRGQSVGLSLMLVPVTLVVMNIGYALSAYPAGTLSDCVDRTIVLAFGLVLLLVADIVLVMAASVWILAAGALLWGLHMGFTQGVFAALIADTAPSNLRGTAFGLFNLVSGVALLLASMIAGALWDAIGPRGTFGAGATLAGLTLAGLLLLRRRLRHVTR